MTSRLSLALEFLLLAAAFAVAHTQSPLFYSNQNQYLLHGLAAGGLGELQSDWLAKTTDPTPLFSLGVELAYRTLGLEALEAGYFFLLMGYFLAVCWLIAGLNLGLTTRRQRLAFATLFIVAHAALFRWFSVQWFRVDYPWYLQAGVAGQYLLGPGLQPSAFGVFLLAGLAAFVNRWPILAIVLQSVACWMHSTYLLPAGLLTVGYLVATITEGQSRRAFLLGIIALVGVLPTIGHTLLDFAPTSADIFAEAQRILAFTRIPHHTRTERWLDGIAVAQLVWIAFGIAVVRRTALFPVLAVAAGGAVILSVAQVLSGHATFALFFPWRISALLVPVATAVIVARMAAAAWTRTLPVTIVLTVLLVMAVLGGVALMTFRWGYAVNEAERGMLTFVRTTGKPGDVFLLPVRIPPVGTGSRGILSTTFMPPPRPKPGSNLIPVDLQRFRLWTGMPIYVDFKAVPYRDVEVLEWKRRMDACRSWYDGGWAMQGVREALRTEGITHVIVSRDQPADEAWLEPVFADDAYIVYRLR